MTWTLLAQIALLIVLVTMCVESIIGAVKRPYKEKERTNGRQP
jgi:hypothetical protein